MILDFGDCPAMKEGNFFVNHSHLTVVITVKHKRNQMEATHEIENQKDLTIDGCSGVSRNWNFIRP